jgi:hypothetical protein
MRKRPIAHFPVKNDCAKIKYTFLVFVFICSNLKSGSPRHNGEKNDQTKKERDQNNG